MKVWTIPVTWEECGTVNVKANTLSEAMDIVREDEEIPVPKESEYVDGSWQLSSDDERYVRLCFNNNQEDLKDGKRM